MESPIQPGKLTIMRAATWSALAMCALVAGACGGGASGAGRASDPGHAGAAASPVTLTLSRADVGRHQRVVAAIDSPVATGVRGRRATGYMLASRAQTLGTGCVNDGAQRFPDAARGVRVRAVLDPTEGAGHVAGWCPGRYRGTVTYFTGFACPTSGSCHTPRGVRAHARIVARFSFRVR